MEKITIDLYSRQKGEEPEEDEFKEEIVDEE